MKKRIDPGYLISLLLSVVLAFVIGAVILAIAGFSPGKAYLAIHTRKVGNCFYLCGDEASEAGRERGLMAPRVAICAAHEANLITEYIINQEIFNEEA